jgi:hypothetical protein
MRKTPHLLEKAWQVLDGSSSTSGMDVCDSLIFVGLVAEKKPGGLVIRRAIP